MDKKKILVVGELHQDLFYQTTFFTDLINSLTDKIYKEKPLDKLEKGDIQKLLLNSTNDFAKKFGGHTYTKRGGNGNNSATLIAKLQIPTQLMTTIGRNNEWMKQELEELNIDTSTIFSVEHEGPISTIIEDPNITKIFVAPNLKEKMNFEDVSLDKSHFKDVSIAFFTPIADKYSNALEMAEQANIITATTVELQKIPNMDSLEKVYTTKSDLAFANLNDAAMICGLDVSHNSDELIELRLKDVDTIFKQYAGARVYTLGKYGAWVITDEETTNIPIIPVDVVNRTGAGDVFAAAFLSYIYSNNITKSDYAKLDAKQKMQLLEKSAYFARAASDIKVSTGNAPNNEELEIFYKKHT